MTGGYNTIPQEAGGRGGKNASFVSAQVIIFVISGI